MATDFPGKGDDQKISLRNSEYPQFDRDFAENIEEFNPEVWELGGNIRGNDAFRLWGRARNGSEDSEVLEWIKEREAWAARHFEDGAQFSGGDLEPNRSNVAGIVAQIKWGVIGTLGEQTMKDTLLELIKKLEGKKDERQLSAEVETGLENKRDEHNEEVGDDPVRRATLPMLREVFERGVGAYETNPGSVRPGVTGPEQWAYARVNSFLFALKNDRFQGGKHDTDLFPADHPLRSEEERAMEEARPYPNEHAARINDPDKYLEFRREADAGGEGIDFIYGIFVEELERVSELQSVRFDADRYTMQESMDWLDENDLEPMKFEEASGERMEPKRHIVEITEDDDSILIKFGKSSEFEGINVMPEEVIDDEEEMTEEMALETERFSKTETMHRSEHLEMEKVDDRRVRMSISSETPVGRGYGDEVLDHSSDAVDLSFLNSGRAPLLVDHEPSVRSQIGVVESVELDSSARRLRATVRFGKDELAEEVYQKVMDGIVGNVSIGYRVTKMARDGENTNVFRATSWQPLEVSIVSIPADPSVGVGRSAESSNEPVNVVPTVEVSIMEQSQEAVRQEALAAFQKDVSEILDLAARHNQRKLADEAIRQGMNLAQFRGLLLEKIADKPLDAPEIEMTQKEKRSYSLMNAIRSAALGRIDGFEAEVSQELAGHYGKEARGFYVPTAIFKRDILTTSPANGSNLVPEDHLGGEFVDALRANLVISGLGARMMQGLKGDVAIPALNAKTAVGFVAENNAPGSEGAPSFRQITMSPKELRQYVDISRKLMMQSDPSVEQVIRDDLTRQFAAKIDEVAIEGGGANEPTGILGTNGIGSVALGTNGGAITYASLVDLEKEVAIDNALAGNLAYLTNPKVVAAMRQTSRQTSGVEGNFILNDTNTVLGYNVASTTLVPSDLSKGTASGTLSAAIFGNFSDLMIGMFGGLDVLVDPYSGSSTGATRIAMYQDIDVAVRHAESFAAIKDIVAS